MYGKNSLSGRLITKEKIHIRFLDSRRFPEISSRMITKKLKCTDKNKKWKNKELDVRFQDFSQNFNQQDLKK